MARAGTVHRAIVPASLCPLTRDDPGYWRRRPADHGPDGLYRDGPRMARGGAATLIGATVSTATPPSPAQAHHAQQQARRRALTRQATPAPALVSESRRCRKVGRYVGPWVRRG